MNDLTLEERDLFEALSRYPHLVDENKAADILHGLVIRLRSEKPFAYKVYTTTVPKTERW